MDSLDSNQKEWTEEKHPLLDQDCKHYLEQAIEAQDVLIYKLDDHGPFLSFWYSALQEKANAHNAMLYAFNFYNPEIRKELKEEENQAFASKASEYFTNLRKAYNSCKKPIVQFIKSFQSEYPREKIYAQDIDWHKDINPEHTSIAEEMQFAWAIARLWQLLESRNKEQLVIHFLGLYKTSEAEKIDTPPPCKADKVPQNIRESLKQQSSESDEFFDSSIRYFDPDYLNRDELCSYLKKACISAVSKNPRSQSTRKPLDTIWLLARFYHIHFYSLKFIIGEKRGLSDRFIKQVETLQDPLILNKFDDSNLERFRHKRIKWGTKQLNIFEILASIKGKSFLEKLIKKSKEVIVGKERNPFENIILNWKKIKSKDSSLDKIDFSDSQYATLLKDNPIAFNTFYIAFAIISDIESSLKPNSSEDKDVYWTNNNNLEEFGLMSLWITYKARQYLEHEKNLSLITRNDVNVEILVLVIAVWALIKIINVFNKQTSPTPSNITKQ